MSWTDDPISDFHEWDAEQNANAAKLPRCCKCKHRIEDTFCYRINDEIYCEECHDNEFKVWTEDFLE